MCSKLSTDDGSTWHSFTRNITGACCNINAAGGSGFDPVSVWDAKRSRVQVYFDSRGNSTPPNASQKTWAIHSADGVSWSTPAKVCGQYGPGPGTALALSSAHVSTQAHVLGARRARILRRLGHATRTIYSNSNFHNLLKNDVFSVGGRGASVTGSARLPPATCLPINRPNIPS